MKVALITWLDAYHANGDATREEVVNDYLELHTAGILIEKTSEAIKVALDYCPEQDDYREVAVIPMKYVKSAVILDVDVLQKKPRIKKKNAGQVLPKA